MNNRHIEPSYEETLIYEHNFKNGMDAWITEGTAEVTIVNGNLQVNSSDSVLPGSTVWHNKVYPGNIKINYSACLLPPLNCSNINIFFNFEDRDAINEERVRTANYGIYHEYKTNILTYLNEGDGTTRIRLRKCPGFKLLEEVRLDGEIPLNDVQQLEIILLDGLILFKANGTALLKYFDPEPYTGGMIGFRTWKTKLWWNDFKVSKIN